MVPGFFCYDDYRIKTSSLTDEEVGILFRALMNYHATHTVPEMPDRVGIAFGFLRPDLDLGDRKYQQKCETNRNNRQSGKTGGKAGRRIAAEAYAEEEPAAEESLEDEPAAGAFPEDESAVEEPLESEPDTAARVKSKSAAVSSLKRGIGAEALVPSPSDAANSGRQQSSTTVNDRQRSGGNKNQNKNPNQNRKQKSITNPPCNSPQGEPSGGPTGDGDGFEVFYKAYPRHVSKRNALLAWRKLNPDPALRDTILSAVEAQKKSDQWTRDGGRYIPHPDTWIRGRRWEDEPWKPSAAENAYAKVNPVCNYEQRDYSMPGESLSDVLDRLERTMGERMPGNSFG